MSSTASASPIAFDNSYAQLPDRFFARQQAQPVAAPHLIKLNKTLATHLGLDAQWLASPDGVAMLAGNAFPAQAAPLAQAYAGHQFGNWVPQLGDGRALLIGEVVNADNERFDIQLKGSGRTPFSRGGDGRAALGPVLREYILCEAMHALGVPTTRALAAVETGEKVMRDGMEPGGIFTRVAASHIRVGTFQYLYAREDHDGIRALVDHVIARHFPQLMDSDNRAAALLGAVVERQAGLIAQWLLIGFIHGVMNTDNMTISGETIDYGPCAFLDDYDPGKVFSSIDRGGRYAYGNQPNIGQWNLSNFAHTLMPVMADDEEAAIAMAREKMASYATIFEARYREGLCAKIGLPNAQAPDFALAQDLLRTMALGRADFTRTFRHLSNLGIEPDDDYVAFAAEFDDQHAVGVWLGAWRGRLMETGSNDDERKAACKAVNPSIIARNHQVEAAISAAYEGNYGLFHALTQALETPYGERDSDDPLTLAPKPGEEVVATFCGT